MFCRSGAGARKSSRRSRGGDLRLLLCTCPMLADDFRLECSDFSEAAQVPRGQAKLGGKERLEDVPGRERSNRAAAHADDVHVVVFDALARREVVAPQSGADSLDFVRTHRSPHAAAADSHSALDLPSGHIAGERDDEIGIIIARVKSMRPEIDDLMPRLAETSNQFFLQT